MAEELTAKHKPIDHILNLKVVKSCLKVVKKTLFGFINRLSTLIQSYCLTLFLVSFREGGNGKSGRSLGRRGRGRKALSVVIVC